MSPVWRRLHRSTSRAPSCTAALLRVPPLIWLCCAPWAPSSPPLQDYVYLHQGLHSDWVTQVAHIPDVGLMSGERGGGGAGAWLLEQGVGDWLARLQRLCAIHQGRPCKH